MSRDFKPAYEAKRSYGTCMVCTQCITGCVALLNPTGALALSTATFKSFG